MNFQATEKYNIILKRFRKWISMKFCFGNVGWNYYHQKPKNSEETVKIKKKITKITLNFVRFNGNLAKN